MILLWTMGPKLAILPNFLDQVSTVRSVRKRLLLQGHGEAVQRGGGDPPRGGGGRHHHELQAGPLRPGCRQDGDGEGGGGQRKRKKN